MGLLSPALTVVVQNSVPVARMGSATTSQPIDHSRSRARASNLAAPRPCRGSPPAPFVRQVGAALGVSAFVLAATVGGFRVALLVMIAVSAGTFACILALPAHSLHAHEVAPVE